jgi:hypothetical protein
MRITAKSRVVFTDFQVIMLRINVLISPSSVHNYPVTIKSSELEVDFFGGCHFCSRYVDSRLRGVFFVGCVGGQGQGLSECCINCTYGNLGCRMTIDLQIIQ